MIRQLFAIVFSIGAGIALIWLMVGFAVLLPIGCILSMDTKPASTAKAAAPRAAKDSTLLNGKIISDSLPKVDTTDSEPRPPRAP